MKRIILGIVCALWGLTVAHAQVDFRPLSYAQTLEAAKTEGKLVFIDCYTEWCGPCKMMASKEFVKPEAGDYFNPKFVCIKVDMEKGEGPELSKKFSVSAYPTFLILDAEGELRGRLVGYATIDKFIDKVEKALKEEKGLPWYQKKFKEGERDPQFLREYQALLSENYMRDEQKTVVKTLLEGKTGAEIAADTALFKTFVAADFGPDDELFLKVYRERTTALKSQPQRLLSKLDTPWRNWGLISLKFEGKEYKGFDMEKFEAYKQKMADYAVPDAQAIEHYILRTNAQYAKDYPTLFKYVQEDMKQPNEQIDDTKLLQELNIMALGYKDKKAQKAISKFAQQRIAYLQQKDTTGEREFEYEGKKTTLTGWMIEQYQDILEKMKK